jgi:PAS domain S-box-containing protein
MAKEISQDSQELFRLIAENVRDFAVFMTDLEGRLLSWNPGVESLLGYAEEEWVGRHGSVIFTPQDRERGAHLQEMETALREGRAEDKRWHVRKDNSRFWADGFLMLLKDGRGEARGFAKILRDDTEAKLTQERLRESEERFQRVVELSPDAIAVHAEGVVLFINTAGARLLGAAGPEQIVGKSIAELIHPDYHAHVRERLEKMGRGEPQPPAEIKFIRLDGTELYGELASAPLLYQGRPAVQAVVRDLTSRRRAEEALRESERRFRLIFNQQFQFMAILSPEGVLVDVNELPLRAVGITREQVLGRLFWETPWWEGLPEMQAGWPARLAEAARSDGPVFSVDAYQAADGSRIAEASITAVRDASARVEFFIVQASDITERKRAEEERERLLREAQEANRLKDEFLATVSHELRTPLTAILGWAHLMRGGQVGGDGMPRALETIERNARAQAQLIDDLLDVSRIVTGKLRLDLMPVNPDSFIDPAIEAVRPAAESKAVRLQKVIDTGVGPVMGDPARLQQVVWNLLSNAVKFTPRGGQVRVSLGRVNSQVEIAVTDTGAGIAPEFLPYVFDRFRQADQRTNRQHGGLGLGLAIVRHLVELHGGSVRADSAGEGAGATFTVTLPVAPIYRREDAEERERPIAGDTPRAYDCPERLDGLRILVADDEPDARELLAIGLGHCGAEVTIASSAREALAAIEREKFDVLVSDIGMPGEDGYELIRRVRSLPDEAGGRTPAVALTAYARTEDRLRALRAGFEMHAAKPVELTELVVIISNLTRRGV